MAKTISSILLIAVIVIVLSLIGGGLFYWFLTNKVDVEPSAALQKQQQISTEDALQDIEEEYALYENEDFGFEFYYPAKWVIVKEGSDMGSAFVQLGKDLNPEGLVAPKDFKLLIFANPPGMGFEYLNNILEEDTINFGKPSVEADRALSTGEVEDKTVKAERLRFNRNQDSYFILYQVDLDKWEEYEPYLEKFKETWKFADENVDIREFSYDDKGNDFKVQKEAFDIKGTFRTEKLVGQSKECGTNKSEKYYEKLMSEYKDGEKGVVYSFEYGKASQKPSYWSVQIIPNRFGYKTLDEFKEDFDFCAAGGVYPFAVSKNYLAFSVSCGTGFSDGSGLPIGCEEVRLIVEPSIKLK